MGNEDIARGILLAFRSTSSTRSVATNMLVLGCTTFAHANDNDNAFVGHGGTVCKMPLVSEFGPGFEIAGGVAALFDVGISNREIFKSTKTASLQS